jgi:hypothetical protein
VKKILKKVWNFFKSFFVNTYRQVKGLGWFLGGLAILVSGIIFYSPTIVTFILYILSGNKLLLTFAIGYAVWWFSPAFSPALLVYGSLLLAITKLFYYLKKRGKKGVKRYGKEER